jgi:hypothetical protein
MWHGAPVVVGPADNIGRRRDGLRLSQSSIRRANPLVLLTRRLIGIHRAEQRIVFPHFSIPTQRGDGNKDATS